MIASRLVVLGTPGDLTGQYLPFPRWSSWKPPGLLGARRRLRRRLSSDRRGHQAHCDDNRLLGVTESQHGPGRLEIMPASDALVLAGLLAAIGLTSLAAGFVAGLLCWIRRSTRTNRCGSEAGHRHREPLRTGTHSARGRAAKEEAVW